MALHVKIILLQMVITLAIPGLEAPSDRLRKVTDEIETKKKSLNQIKKKRDGHRKLLKQLKNKKKTAREKLYLAEKDLELTREYIENLRQTEANVDSNIGNIHASLLQIETQLEEKRSYLRRLIRSTYKRNRYNEIDAFFEATSPRNYFQKVKWMHRITEHTEDVIASIKDQQRIVVIGQDMLEGYRTEIQKIKSEKKNEEDLFSEKHEKQKDILKEISSKEEHTRLVMQKLEAREQIMRNLIVILENKRRKAEIELASPKKPRASFKDLKFSKGRLVWPVYGSVIKQFGNLYDPQLKITLYNPGIDIQAKTGDPVAAAAPGRVVAIEWKPGYGNFIILDHENGYYSIYAHLSKIMVGLDQVVPGGAQIAKAGATGSFEGPKLHFEIRKGGRALNPLKWLSS